MEGYTSKTHDVLKSASAQMLPFRATLLGKLADELQLMIFALTLSLPAPVVLYSATSQSLTIINNEILPPNTLALTRVCREINAKAKFMCCGDHTSNTFTFGSAHFLNVHTALSYSPHTPTLRRSLVLHDYAGNEKWVSSIVAFARRIGSTNCPTRVKVAVDGGTFPIGVVMDRDLRPRCLDSAPSEQQGESRHHRCKLSSDLDDKRFAVEAEVSFGGRRGISTAPADASGIFEAVCATR